MVVPQTELSVKDADVKRDSVGNGLLDALSNGTLQGVRLAVNVAALLLVFVACIALVNYLLGGILGRYTGLMNGYRDFLVILLRLISSILPDGFLLR